MSIDRGSIRTWRRHGRGTAHIRVRILNAVPRPVTHTHTGRVDARARTSAVGRVRGDLQGAVGAARALLQLVRRQAHHPGMIALRCARRGTGMVGVSNTHPSARARTWHGSQKWVVPKQNHSATVQQKRHLNSVARSRQHASATPQSASARARSGAPMYSVPCVLHFVSPDTGALHAPQTSCDASYPASAASAPPPPPPPPRPTPAPPPSAPATPHRRWPPK